MATSKKEVAKKTADSKASPAKKAVKKAVETAKPEPDVKETAVKKAAPVQAPEQSEKKTAFKKLKQSDMPDIDAVVKITVDGNTSRAIVTGVHGGLKIDAVVQPSGADNYAIGSVPYAGDTDLEPYWNF